MMLTQKDNFLTRDEYCQLVYSALEGLPRYQSDPKSRVHLLPPAILKPVPLWTGKQVISSLLFGLTGDLPEPACFMDVERKAKVSAAMWGENSKLPGAGRGSLAGRGWGCAGLGDGARAGACGSRVRVSGAWLSGACRAPPCATLGSVRCVHVPIASSLSFPPSPPPIHSQVTTPCSSVATKCYWA